MNSALALPLAEPHLPVLRGTHSVLRLDVAAGCQGGCVHCPGPQAFESAGELRARSRVVPGVAEQVARELEALAGKGQRPLMVRVGVRSDPLMPAPGVTEATVACLTAILERGVAVELHTRSAIPDSVARVLSQHASMARVIMGVVSVRDSAQRVYEPGLIPVQGRLRSLRPLVAAGVEVVARVEPLLPLVTDTDADVEAMLELALSCGVKQVELAYLRLTSHTAKAMTRGLPRMHREMLKGLFAQEPWVNAEDGPSYKLLPLALREAGYERARAVAARVGLTCTVCAEADPQCGEARRPVGWSGIHSRPPARPAADRLASQLTLFGPSHNDG